jgi:hypothetical protein
LIAKIAALLLSIILAFFLLSSIFSDTSSDTAFAWEMFERLWMLAALYATFGVGFGLASPRPTWRWGLWLNVPALFLLTILLLLYLSSIAAGSVGFRQAQDQMEALLLFGLFAGPLVAACLGAYAGAWARHHFSSE